MSLTKVVLPEPERPTRPTFSPAAIFTEKSAKSGVAWPP